MLTFNSWHFRAALCRQNLFETSGFADDVCNRCIWSSAFVLNLIRTSSNADSKSIPGTWTVRRLCLSLSFYCALQRPKLLLLVDTFLWWVWVRARNCKALVDANDSDFLKCRWWKQVRIKVGVTVALCALRLLSEPRVALISLCVPAWQ